MTDHSIVAHAATVKHPSAAVYPNILAKMQCVSAPGARAWVIMLARAQQNQGRHHATLDELMPYSPLSRRTLRYGLAAACKAGFVTVQNGVYQMQGAAAIAARLNVTNPGRAVAITISTDLAQFRAAIYSAWLAQRRDQRPSRAEIMATFGVSLPTLLAWEKAAGVQCHDRI